MPRAIRGVFLGYSFSKKGYNVLCIDTNTFTVSRDVSFGEEVFPFLTDIENPTLQLDFFQPPIGSSTHLPNRKDDASPMDVNDPSLPDAPSSLKPLILIRLPMTKMIPPIL